MFFEKKSLQWTTVLIKLQPCSTQPSILSKKLSSCKLSGGSFHWRCRSRVHPSNFIKKDSILELFLHVSCAVALFNLLKNLLRESFQGDLYCVKNYHYIHMPIRMPMVMPMPICPYWDFQMAVSLDFVSFIWKRSYL